MKPCALCEIEPATIAGQLPQMLTGRPGQAIGWLVLRSPSQDYTITVSRN